MIGCHEVITNIVDVNNDIIIKILPSGDYIDKCIQKFDICKTTDILVYANNPIRIIEDTIEDVIEISVDKLPEISSAHFINTVYTSV
jgi:hypothetical protein